MSQQKILKFESLQNVLDAAESATEAANTAAGLLPDESVTIKQWVTAESFNISNMTFSSNGNIATADLIWVDGEVGTISNLIEDDQGRITSLRYNRPSAKYITQTITYDSNGNVTTNTLTATGY